MYNKAYQYANKYSLRHLIKLSETREKMGFGETWGSRRPPAARLDEKTFRDAPKTTVGCSVASPRVPACKGSGTAGRSRHRRPAGGRHRRRRTCEGTAGGEGANDSGAGTMCAPPGHARWRSVPGAARGAVRRSRAPPASSSPPPLRRDRPPDVRTPDARRRVPRPPRRCVSVRRDSWVSSDPRGECSGASWNSERASCSSSGCDRGASCG